jgi:hypothetical protein
LHGPLKKNNKNYGKKIKFGPPPNGPPRGRFLGFFRLFLNIFEEKKKKKIHGPLEKNIKNYGKKIKFGPPPPGPLGAIYRFFLENFIILTKRGDINPPKNSETPPGPLWGVFRFFESFF